jgi:hypothetical protein
VEATPEPPFPHPLVRGVCGNPVALYGGPVSRREREFEARILFLSPNLSHSDYLASHACQDVSLTESGDFGSEIYFTYHTLTGRKTPVPSDTGSRHALPIVRCICVAKIYFTYHILTGRRSLLPSDTESRHALPIVRCVCVAKTYFTYHILTGRRILRLSNDTIVGLTANKSRRRPEF